MSPNPINRYRFAWPILLTLSSALGAWLAMNGFQSKSPAQRFAVLEDADSRIVARVDSLEVTIDEHAVASEARDEQLAATLDALLILGCGSISKSDLQKTRLVARCRRTLEGAAP